MYDRQLEFLDLMWLRIYKTNYPTSSLIDYEQQVRWLTRICDFWIAKSIVIDIKDTLHQYAYNICQVFEKVHVTTDLLIADLQSG